MKYHEVIELVHEVDKDILFEFHDNFIKFYKPPLQDDFIVYYINRKQIFFQGTLRNTARLAMDISFALNVID